MIELEQESHLFYFPVSQALILRNKSWKHFSDVSTHQCQGIPQNIIRVYAKNNCIYPNNYAWKWKGDEGPLQSSNLTKITQQYKESP